MEKEEEVNQEGEHVKEEEEECEVKEEEEESGGRKVCCFWTQVSAEAAGR